MSVRHDIEKKLSLKFTPSHLEVLDESEKHRGHAGSRPGGETHFRVRISSRELDSLGRVAQHRAVMETLDTELKSGVHALAIEVVKTSASAG